MSVNSISKRVVKRRFVPGVRKADKEYYRELLKTLDLGLEDRLTVEQLLSLFSQASGSDEVDDKLVLS